MRGVHDFILTARSIWAILLLLPVVILVGSGVSRAGSDTGEEGQRCVAHQLLLNECFFCDSALREPGRLWCAEHDRYEDRCFICHPDQKDADRLFCDEHNLYEDECVFCHPELAEKDSSPVATEKKGGNTPPLQCLEHRVAEEDCGICHPDLLTGLGVGEGLLIRFESEQSAAKAGVVTALAGEGKSLSGLVAFGRVTYDLNHFTRVTPRTAGVVQRVLVDVGDDVVLGQPLVEILSSEVAQAQNEYVSNVALARLKGQVFERVKKLSASRASSQKEYERVFTEYEMAKQTTTLLEQQLLNIGLSREQVHLLKQTGSISSTIQILAPCAGTIVERRGVVGEVVQPGDLLVSVVDLSSMWLEISIPEDRLNQVRLGDYVEASFSVLSQSTYRGRMSWIATAVDGRSRMVMGRAIIGNPDHHLKHDMFTTVRISPQETGRNLHIPVAGLQKIEGRSFVFIKHGADLFEIRRVEVGGRDTEVVDILAGITPDEQLVVEHSFTLKSEYLKSRLGAGCVDD